MGYKIDKRRWKQLKDAGYPFKKTGEFKKKDISGQTDLIRTYEEYDIPTEGELIHELGKDFSDLVRMDEKNIGVWFQAWPTEEAFEYTEVYGFCPFIECCGYESGDTPVEALVELYIMIHAKR